MYKARLIFLYKALILCVVVFPVSAQPRQEIKSIFIPIWQGFDFEQAAIVDSDEGDIVISPYGIETVSLETEIAALEKGFIEDVKSLPEEEVINWTHFEDYAIDMLYAVRTSTQHYVLLELIDVKVSDEEIIGVTIDYKYQPNGSRSF